MSSGESDGGATSPGCAEVTLLSESITAAVVTGLRHAVTEAAGAAGLADEALEDFVLAVHELVTNVIRHGGGNGRVVLQRHRNALTCEVSDDGPGLGDVSVTLAGPGQVGHRGLWLAQQLADGLEITSGEHGTTARVSARLPGTPASKVV